MASTLLAEDPKPAHETNAANTGNTAIDAKVANETNATNKAETDPLKAAYALCSQYGDAAAAGSLAYQIAATSKDPAEVAKWKEEIAKIQFATGRYASCLQALADLKSNHDGGKKPPLHEMEALCREALGDKPEAIACWKTVFAENGSAVAALHLAGLQFDTGALDDAEKTISAGLAAKDAKTIKISLPKSKDEMQQVPAAAALHNLRAVLVLKRNPEAKEDARPSLLAALDICADFELAKRNLDGLQAPPPSGGETGSAPTDKAATDKAATGNATTDNGGNPPLQKPGTKF